MRDFEGKIIIIEFKKYKKLLLLKVKSSLEIILDYVQ